MSWFVFDAEGDGGDISSNGGLLAMADAVDCPAALRAFLESGTADQGLAKRVIDECAGKEKYNHVAELFGPLKPPITLSDGVCESGDDDQDD